MSNRAEEYYDFLKTYPYPKRGRETIGMLVYKIYFPALMHGHHHYPTTYSFPVRFKLVDPWAGNYYSFNLDAWIKASADLEKEGAAAITSCCGRVGVLQREISESVNIPVFSSTLLQIPLLQRSLKRGKKIGVLTSPSAFKVIDKILESCNIEKSAPIVIEGMKATTAWTSQWTGPYDPWKTEKEVVSTALSMISKSPEISMFLLECTEMSLYSSAVSEATGMLVFDSVSLIKYVYGAIVKQRFF